MFALIPVVVGHGRHAASLSLTNIVLNKLNRVQPTTAAAAVDGGGNWVSNFNWRFN